MNNGGKSFFIKKPEIETLAIELFNQEGLYGCSWQQLSEKTREDYRKQARGEKPFAVGVQQGKPRTNNEEKDQF